MSMKKEKLISKLTGNAVKTLDLVLQMEANSTSCMVFYEPKAPKDLKRYKKK